MVNMRCTTWFVIVKSIKFEKKEQTFIKRFHNDVMSVLV